MKLIELNRSDVERVRLWRNKDIAAFRTPYLLTQEMQQDFYDEVTKRDHKHRFWAIYNNKGLVGMCGLINIQWENSIAEISLIINPALQGHGLGARAVGLLLEQGFEFMNLHTVFGEAYSCTDAMRFWKKIAAEYNACTTTLPARKYWNGRYWSSLYFSIDRDEYRKTHSALYSA